MSGTTIGLDQTEEELLAYEVSDEALETAAGTGSKQAGNYTLVCTFFHYCPIWAAHFRVRDRFAIMRVT
jgi:hypothetical protein